MNVKINYKLLSEKSIVIHPRSYYIINAITIYRIIAAPFILYLVFDGSYDIFKWLLGISFFTDLIDGYLARKYKVISILGARLDSIGDDLTIVVGIVGLIVFKTEFFKDIYLFLILLFVLFFIQTIYAFLKYKKTTSFHTYLAKIAALMQGGFLLILFFTPKPDYILFYITVFITAIDLAEEIILVSILENWETNVKGLYWVLKRKQNVSRIK